MTDNDKKIFWLIKCDEMMTKWALKSDKAVKDEKEKEQAKHDKPKGVKHA